jgi:hypothetical protein
MLAMLDRQEQRLALEVPLVQFFALFVPFAIAVNPRQAFDGAVSNHNNSYNLTKPIGTGSRLPGVLTDVSRMKSEADPGACHESVY